MRPILALALALVAMGLLRPAPAGAVPCDRPGARGAFDCDRRPLFASPTPPADSITAGARYGWIADYARFYEAPDEESKITRYASSGFFFGPVADERYDEDGERWVHVWDGWLPGRYFHDTAPSTFAGVEVNAVPLRPFGWVKHPFQPLPAPDGAPEPEGQSLPKYHRVQIYDFTLGPDGIFWYDIGGQRWLPYYALALVTLRDRPAGVAAGAYWVAVDLNQQTFAAYEGERLVYAGMISSGVRAHPTRTGLFKVWLRYPLTLMAGGDEDEYPYYLEDVPHTMYFDREIGLHGAYWHDDFGYPRSHGCVNMPPRAAEWVYDWSAAAPDILRVWVHRSSYADFG